MILEPASVYRAASAAADEILSRYLRHDVAKAKLNPLDRRDFTAIVRRISGAVGTAAGDAQTKALRAALPRLDINWPALSNEQRDAAYRAIHEALGAGAPRIAEAVDVVLRGEAPGLAGDVRAAATDRYRLHIPSSLSLVDQHAVEHAATTQANFVRDGFGQRSEAYSERARGIVSSGLERGLGRDDIAADLADELETAVGRGESYWQVVAGAFAGNARSYSLVSSFGDAGIKRLRYSAVLDAVTSDVCRFLDGRVFEVPAARKLLDSVATMDDPEDVVAARPWASLGKDADGNPYLYYRQGDSRQVIAQVDRSGVGADDDKGEYSDAMSDDALAAAGVMVPPMHGSCRSTLVPAD